MTPKRRKMRETRKFTGNEGKYEKVKIIQKMNVGENFMKRVKKKKIKRATENLRKQNETNKQQ